METVEPRPWASSDDAPPPSSVAVTVTLVAQTARPRIVTVRPAAGPAVATDGDARTLPNVILESSRSGVREPRRQVEHAGLPDTQGDGSELSWLTGPASTATWTICRDDAPPSSVAVTVTVGRADRPSCDRDLRPRRRLDRRTSSSNRRRRGPRTPPAN